MRNRLAEVLLGLRKAKICKATIKQPIATISDPPLVIGLRIPKSLLEDAIVRILLVLSPNKRDEIINTNLI